MEINIEINKIKVVLLALWYDKNHPEAIEIINQFNRDIEEIQKGN